MRASILRPFLLLLVPLAILGGCDSTTDTDDNAEEVVGTYQLQTVDGEELPIVEEFDGWTFEFLGVMLTIESDNDWIWVESYRETDPEGDETTDTAEYTGTYTIDGNELDFTVTDDGETYTGVWSGNTLTITFTDPGEPDEVYVFTRTGT